MRRLTVTHELSQRGGVVSAYASYLIQTFVTLVAVCGVAFVVLYGARKLGAGKAQGAISLAGRLPLDARRSVVLVRVGAHVFVVGVSDAGFTRLGEVDAGELPVVEPAPDAFSKVLARVTTKRSTAREDA